MRIPPLYRSRNWQLFLAGMAVGGVISWMIFLYMYGVYQEEQTALIAKQKNEIEELQNDNELLMEDKSKLNEENKRMLTVQDIKVEIVNHNKYDLDSLTVHMLEKDVRNDLRELLTQNVQSVAKSKSLLKKAIENKVYERNETKYRFAVDTIYFDTIIEISLNMIKD